MQRHELLNRLAKRIKQLRGKHKISQEDLAAQAGLSRIGMGQIEQAKKAANILTLHKIAQGFGISISELTKGIDKND
jgi:transcriptional regulator with XRE-family HTH domain